MGRIYLSPPDVGPLEREALLGAFDSNWITPLGPEVDAFERELAARCGAESAAALSSGTAALHLALVMNGVGPGDEVLVSDLTFVAPANAVRYVGADLRFVDAERETWNMDPDLLDDLLERRDAAGERQPAAVIVVDLYGQCAQLDRIAATCERHGVLLVEDAAEALGASWQGRSAGAWAELGAFSFNGNKIITTGGGGALVGSADAMARARSLAAQARRPVLHYEHEEVGFNYRLSNLLAGLGRGQLARLDDLVARRHAVNARYREALAGVDGITFMPWDERGHANGWLTVVLLDDALGVAPPDVCRSLDELDIEARPAWKPMHLQPVFDGVPVEGGDVAEDLFRRGLCLPSGSVMADDDVDRVVEALLDALAPSRLAGGARG